MGMKLHHIIIAKGYLAMCLNAGSRSGQITHCCMSTCTHTEDLHMLPFAECIKKCEWVNSLQSDSLTFNLYVRFHAWGVDKLYIQLTDHKSSCLCHLKQWQAVVNQERNRGNAPALHVLLRRGRHWIITCFHTANDKRYGRTLAIANYRSGLLLRPPPALSLAGSTEVMKC